MRSTRDEMLMEVADAVSKRGTCSRLQVGAVFSKDGRIISTGYNGAVAGMPHCVHDSFLVPSEWGYPTHEYLLVPKWVREYSRMFEGGVLPGTLLEYDGHTVTGSPSGKSTSTGCDIAEHAERNAIAYAARFGVALDGSEVHVTHAPCLACSRTLVNAGITKVTFKTAYRLTAGVELLTAAGISIVDWGIKD